MDVKLMMMMMMMMIIVFEVDFLNRYETDFFPCTSGKPIGDTVLYFGCRRQDEDFIYEDELNKYAEEGVLSKLYVAFSRDQAQKVYVQNLMAEHGEEIWNILDQKGHVYVCG